MIKKKTVFVLGAGASKPYGYPTGEELFGEVLNLLQNSEFKKLLNLAFPSKNAIRISGGKPLPSKTKSEVEFESFIQDLADCGLVSVDGFIEKKSEYSSYCKFAIAYLLLKRETNNPFNAAGEGDWYRYLFPKLLNGKNFDETLENNVSFITFNYDVSFDSFLIRALSTQYENCDFGKYFSKNPIIHVHGRVRSFEHSKIHRVIDFKNENCFKDVLDCSENIKFYFEQGSAEVIEKARLEFKKAQNVFFLGFGFLQDNMEKLKINWVNNFLEKNYLFTNYFGTAFKLERAEISKIILDNKAIDGSGAEMLHLLDCDCLSLIRKHVNELG